MKPTKSDQANVAYNELRRRAASMGEAINEYLLARLFGELVKQSASAALAAIADGDRYLDEIEQRRAARTYLDVPFKQNDQARAAGAFWDPGARRWYIKRETPPHKFLRWMPRHLKAPPPQTRTAPTAVDDTPPWDDQQ